MARAPRNKAELARQKKALGTYQRFLPSLDMKRKQLLAERQRARDELAELQGRQAELRRRVAETLPMLADRQVAVADLLRLTDVELETRNVVGVALPRLEAVHFAPVEAGYLAYPHWIDQLRDLLRRQIELAVAAEVAQERLARLEAALKTVTQRVNLFDKVLIPRTKSEIQDIEIALGDAERAGVVRAKIAKRKRAEAA